IARQEIEEGELGRNVARDDRRLDAVAVGEGDSGDPAVGGVDTGDLRVSANFETLRPAVGSDRLGEGAHAAADETPAAGAGVLAHQVMRDDVSRARAFWPDKSADAAVIGQHRLDMRALEPF